MGRTFFILCLSTIILFSFSINSEVIQNQENPSELPGKIPGRSIKLTEVQRITDYEDDFVFRKVRGIKIAEDGSIFVRGRDQLLEFTPQGKYVRNFIKKGEGPGEVKYFSNFAITDKSIIVGGLMPVKVIKFSPEGELKNEFTIQGLSTFATLIENLRSKSYFVSGESFINKQKTGIIPRENNLYYVNKTGNVVNMNLSFNTKDLLVKRTSKDGVIVSMDELTVLLWAFDKRGLLYISHTERYLISLIDLKSQKVIRKFHRAYKPVDYVKRKYTKKEEIELYSLDNRKSYNDIYKLIVYKENLFVFTSTMNEKKETLIDVFDSTGKYVDKFFIKIPGVKRPDDLIRKPILFHDGFFWTIDVDEDDAPYVLKYKIDQRLSH